MAIPSIPANFLITPGAGKNTASWDEVIDADTYNLYWKKDKTPNDYFANLDNWTIVKTLGSESATIVDGKLLLDIENSTAGEIFGRYNFDLFNEDYSVTIDTTNYTPDSSANGVVFRILLVNTDSTIGFQMYFLISSGQMFGATSYRNGGAWTILGYITPPTLTTFPTKLRFVRTGTEIKSWYYTDSWHGHKVYDFGANAAAITKIDFGFYHRVNNGGSLELDNLIITPSVKDDYDGVINDIVGLTYDHTSVDVGDVYYYEVTAENISGESDASLEEYGIPAPSGLAAPVIAGAYDALTDGDSQNTITISEIFDATIYNIYWSLTPGVTINNGTKIADITSPYEHVDLTRQNYYYVVTAENAEYESDISNEICLKPDFDGKIFNHNDIIISRLLYQYKNRE